MSNYFSSPEFPQTQHSGFVEQDDLGRWYGWRYIQDEEGYAVPHLISEDGTASFTLEQASLLGLALPVGYSAEQLQSVMQSAARSVSHNHPDANEPKQHFSPQSAQENVSPKPTDSSNHTSHETGSYQYSSFAPGADTTDTSNNQNFLNDVKSPGEWKIYEGWLTATKSFVLNDVALRGKIGRSIFARSVKARKLLLATSAASPALVPLEAINPIPGDEIFTSAFVLWTLNAIVKRRSDFKNGLI